MTDDKSNKTVIDDPLNPSSEQKLMEKLSMGEEHYGVLEFIRRQMIKIIEDERKNTGK